MSIETSPFGRTGHASTRIIFGAAALGSVDQATADRAVRTVLDHGINHFDVAASYGDAELRLGPWMERIRGEVFLATKTGERRKEAAADEIRRSLERLRTDHVDLLQLHNLVDADEWEVAMGPGGALEAAVEARDEGLVRCIGVTGHGLEVARRHLQSLERFAFDSVLLPYSWIMMQNEAYAADVEELFEVCERREIAVQTIKAVTRRPWGARPQDRATWYQPLEHPTAIDLSVHWVLGRRGVFLNTVGDVDVLPKVLESAERFERRPGETDMEALAREKEMEPLFVS